MQIRRSNERGHANHGWLNSYHSFSFAQYFDQQWMGFGPLRVLNEDTIAPDSGFGTHGHKDMEIISYVLAGQLAHKDNIGNGSVIQPGDVQRMSAGTGVMHSEFNHASVQTHFLQIWIQPNQLNLVPSYEQKYFSAEQKQGVLRLIASPTGIDGSITIHQNVQIFAGLFHDTLGVVQTACYPLAVQRLAYVHVAGGEIHINNTLLAAGDAALFRQQSDIQISGGKQAEVLLFDLPTDG